MPVPTLCCLPASILHLLSKVGTPAATLSSNIDVFQATPAQQR